jgi:hypothetical protein
MLKSGWEPFHSKDADDCFQGDDRCEGRPEMFSCSGTGLAYCKYLWKKNGKTTAICAIGEINNTYSGVCEI